MWNRQLFNDHVFKYLLSRDLYNTITIDEKKVILQASTVLLR